MKTNEKYQHHKKQPPIQDGEHPLDFARRIFPDKKNIQHGAPESQISEEEEKRIDKILDDFIESLDEWFGDDPEKEIKI